MRNVTYSLFFVLWTALPSTQNIQNEKQQQPELKVQVEKIIQHKKDSIFKEVDSLRYDVYEIKIKQDRINRLRLLEKKLDKELQQIKDENQYKRITKEFDF